MAGTNILNTRTINYLDRTAFPGPPQAPARGRVLEACRDCPTIAPWPHANREEPLPSGRDPDRGRSRSRGPHRAGRPRT